MVLEQTVFGGTVTLTVGSRAVPQLKALFASLDAELTSLKLLTKHEDPALNSQADPQGSERQLSYEHARLETLLRWQVNVLGNEPRRQLRHAFVDHVDANRREVLQAERDGRQRQIVWRAVFECLRAFRQVIAVALHGRDRDRPAHAVRERVLHGVRE